MNKVGRKVFRELRTQVKEMKLEREKNEYKQKMWSKVNTWLHDLDTTGGVAKQQPSGSGHEIDSIMTQDAELHLRDTNTKTPTIVQNHQVSSTSREDEFSFYQNHAGSTDKKNLKRNVDMLEAIAEDSQFTFSGDKRESIH